MEILQCTNFQKRKWLLKPGAVPSINVPNSPAAKLQFQSTSENIIDETRSMPSIDIPPASTLVIPNVGELEFPSTFKNVMDNHILSQDILDNHRSQLCKNIIELYLNIRLFYEAHKISEKEVYL
nr:PREDICTED: uncharacterized protein LOC105668213 isoform X2 [Linepithema humile]